MLLFHNKIAGYRTPGGADTVYISSQVGSFTFYYCCSGAQTYLPGKQNGTRNGKYINPAFPQIKVILCDDLSDSI